MDESVLEGIPMALQGVAMPEADVARAVSFAGPSNRRVREAADRLLGFEDEPGRYLGYLAAEATGR